MKRFLLLILSTILLFSLVACSDNDDNTEVENKAEDAEVEEETDTNGEEVQDEEEPKEEELSREDKIKSVVEAIIHDDLNSTDVNKLEVNENLGLDDGSYIVLPHLKWNVKNKEKTTREMLEMYSDHLAVKLAEESDVSEITVFWEVPYHLEGDNIAKFMYERSGDGMAKTDNWFAPVLQ